MFVFYWIYWKWLLIFMCHQKLSNMHLVCISSTHTQNKGISQQPDWSEKYNKHIKKRTYWTIFCLIYFEGVSKTQKKSQFLFHRVPTYFLSKCVFIIFWFVLVIENQDEEFIEEIVIWYFDSCLQQLIVNERRDHRCNYFWKIYSVI